MEDKLNILIIIAGLAIGEHFGGAEKAGAELACALNKKEFNPVVCAFWRRNARSEDDWIYRLDKAGVEVFFAAEHRKNIVEYIKGIKRITCYLQNRGFDIIHSHFQLGSIAAILLKKTLGAKALIRTAHAGKEWGDGPIAFLCRQVLTNWFFPFLFNVEIGVSKSIVDALDKRPGARIVGKKALLVYNAVPLDRFAFSVGNRNLARSEIGLPADSPVVGYVGRLRKEKGLTTLIDAAAIVHIHRPEVKFLIVGDGEMRDSLSERVRNLGLSDVVIFIGARQDVEYLYQLMDLFVLPSFWEGLPIAILESMASGVPVIATDLPGVRELILHEHTGWLVRPGDPRSLALTILEALSDPNKCSKVAQTALQEVVLRFSLTDIAKQHENIYKRWK
ncbi:MAG: glycosyltransferase family 4 protein [Nitrososphaerota archaeon]